MNPFPDNGTSRLIIRIMEQCDAEEARLLHNEDSTLMRLSDVAHVSEESQLAWFRSVSQSCSSKRYVARTRAANDFVGVFRLDRIDHWNRSAFVGADVAPAARGQGYASEMYGYFFEYLFNQCGLNRLALVTLESNEPALRLYEKLGFVEEGREREAIFRDGRFQDLVSMGLLASEWRQKA
ncbi:GNAT family N-acetyltransferase [Nitrogeniibacter aestuarii]|uniref:GNAT family N-acetyltransferase n=1 Tax=Nitrogeniibacter aestuarii TaxID=2815343 RepID=UPI001D12C1F7|nr:GNAT family protein [Nitrogeniibacter aestuarii]